MHKINTLTPSYDLRPKTRKTKTRKTKTRKTKTRKTKTLFFFLGEIIKFQLPLPLSGKMNKVNALTLKKVTI